MLERKILLADDEAVVHSLLRRTWAAPPYRLVSAFNGSEAVALAQAEKPDLILLDIGMPGKSGREVLKELRRNIHTQMIPVIFLTGNGGLRDKLVGFEMGADDYITKPFEMEELKARVDGALRRTRRDLSANPLTRLPGSPSIEEEVNRRIREKRPFAFFYIDIDNFKAFNDLYGYAMGDRVIQDTAAILLDSIGGAEDDFVGHVGGDDFVVIARPSSADEVAGKIMAAFDGRAASYYSREDAARGCVLTKDRRGRERPFPLMSLSIAVAANDKRPLEHYARVVDVARELKHFLKSRPEKKGSAFLKDRRTGDAPR